MEELANQLAFPLKGKFAIVTGSSRGIGAGIAWELALRGANVFITYVSDKSKVPVEELQARIGQLPHKPSTWACQVDLSTTTGAEEVMSHLKATFGDELKIDILVNNAGVELMSTIQNVTLEDYDRIFNLNVRGTLLMTKAVVPYLVPKGRIINLSSVAARAGAGGFAVYCASKAAVEGFTRSWAHDLGSNGTTVNSVVPGAIPSDLLDRLPQEIVEFQKTITPVEHRTGTTQEIGTLVAWLASPEASWVSGQNINASGGLTMT